jgi:cytochrome c oxidase assembly factor CtaG
MNALLAATSLPPLRGSQLTSTTFDALPVILIVGALALYLWGVRRIARLRPRHPWSSLKTAAFVGALVTTAISIFSFIGVYEEELFWVHMVQHLLLIMVAAPLFAVSSPIDLFWRASTGSLHARFTALLRTRAAQILGHPGVAFVAYAVLIPITHLTVWYNYTLEHPSVDNLEHVLFLILGYLFWRQIFGSDPNRYHMHPALQFGYLFLAIPIDTFTGLSLNQTTHEIFPAYHAFHRTWGPSLVQDLHIGGVLMWVAGDTLMLWPMIPVALSWMHLEERKAVRIDRQLDAKDAADEAELARFLSGPAGPVNPAGQVGPIGPVES